MERFWLRRQTLGPILLGYQKTADNGDFATNCIDNLSGSDDLISIRGGQKFARPFDRVKEIEQAAEQNYLREVQDLEDKIASTEGKISELQRTREDGSSLILTPEQEAEIDKLREEQLESRKKLRAVNHEMQKDIEGLGFTLQVVHLGAVPLGFLLLSLIFSLARIARRS